MKLQSTVPFDVYPGARQQQQQSQQTANNRIFNTKMSNMKPSLARCHKEIIVFQVKFLIKALSYRKLIEYFRTTNTHTHTQTQHTHTPLFLKMSKMSTLSVNRGLQIGKCLHVTKRYSFLPYIQRAVSASNNPVTINCQK